MATIQKFDRNMIERYLREKDWRYLKDNDGDIQVSFGYDEDFGCRLSLWFMAVGSSNEVYTVRILSDKSIPKSDWGRVIMLCNSWNKQWRWPTAYLHIGDVDQDTSGYIILENHIDLQTGVHQELLNDFSDKAIGAALRFWEWAHKEQGL